MPDGPRQRASLRHLGPGWFAVVMGLAGLALAWLAAVPVLGQGAAAAGTAIGGVAALALAGLAVASLLRLRRHAEAWAEDLRHPVRHVLVAAPPIALLLVATVAVALGVKAWPVRALWWLASGVQLAVTVWVASRWWQGGGAAPAGGGGLQWASITPALFVPIVGSVLVPLAGVQLGHAAWSAAQFGIGLMFWPVVLVLLVVRLAQHGPLPERLLPSAFIVVAPPAAIGLACGRLGAPLPVQWALWGAALGALLWVLPLLRRVAAAPFGIGHWGMSFPMAAFSSLTLRLVPDGMPAVLGIALLAITSLLVAALALATLRGLRDGSLPAPETLPIAVAPGGTGSGTPAG